ncbi:MAG: hypothetical protein ACYST3_07275 [Planctomycetota bacterium]
MTNHCQHCKGTGRMECQYNGILKQMFQGLGKSISGPCQHCRGTGLRFYLSAYRASFKGAIYITSPMGVN